jgi:hypothetical protein
VIDCNYSAHFISNCIFSSKITCKTVYSITVLIIVLRICEPSYDIYLLCAVIISHAYLYVHITSYFCLLMSVSSMYSACERVVSSMSSGREGGVFTYDGSLSVCIKNRFRVASRLRQAGLVGSESQQTIVLGCDLYRRRRIYRAGKCWNLTGTGTQQWFIFSSCLVWI